MGSFAVSYSDKQHLIYGLEFLEWLELAKIRGGDNNRPCCDYMCECVTHFRLEGNQSQQESGEQKLPQMYFCGWMLAAFF